MKICLTEKPEVMDFGGGHCASCWMNVLEEYKKSQKEEE
jgi:hypothetical protein